MQNYNAQFRLKRMRFVFQYTWNVDYYKGKNDHGLIYFSIVCRTHLQ